MEALRAEGLNKRYGQGDTEVWALRYQCNWPGETYEQTMRAQLKRQGEEYDAAGRHLARMTLVKGEG